jgi:hypothetical protein
VPAPTVENSPPTILLSGPEITPGERIRGPVSPLWIIPGDRDGADDIAVVRLEIESAVLTSLIVRPDSVSEPCRLVHYADMDTIDVMPLLSTTTFHSEFIVTRGSNGVYGRGLGYTDLIRGGLVDYAEEFGPRVKNCWSGSDHNLYFETFGLYPPAIPAARDVHVTYAEFSLSGVTFTVHDQSGASATVTFPDFTVYLTNGLEEATLP